jgi:hypothetical protein
VYLAADQEGNPRKHSILQAPEKHCQASGVDRRVVIPHYRTNRQIKRLSL